MDKYLAFAFTTSIYRVVWSCFLVGGSDWDDNDYVGKVEDGHDANTAAAGDDDEDTDDKVACSIYPAYNSFGGPFAYLH